ncbi:baseplate assembly protein [Paenibacillus sp. SN-8-1]|uniref:baseplate assembly protein n=1 Tax=Paenibacillus sp. SN-8-1 TaxID=3435409 RepID=UPI003D9A272D
MKSQLCQAVVKRSRLMTVFNLQFVSVDVDQTVNQIISIYEATAGRKLFLGDPVRLFLLSIAQIIVQQRVLINQVKQMDHLRYATGDYLDVIGELYGVSRLLADAAITTIEITLSMPLNSATIIPKGTRIAPQGGEGSLFFLTSEVVEIPPGSLMTRVTATSSVTGIAGNGFLPGQLNVLVDPIPFVISATNITISAGGAEIESDEEFRVRIRTAPEGFSVAGPEGAYQFWARTASPSITDVSVTSPKECEVVVIPLLKGGELPTTDQLDAVAEALNDRSVRPLTDKVTVKRPDVVPYDIDLTYFIGRERAAEASTIQSAVNTAVSQYILWQKSKLSRGINTSELIARVMATRCRSV